MNAFRKALASGLVATLLVAQQGPLFYQALAQTVAASASGASSGSLGASAGSLQSGGSLGSGPRSAPSLLTGAGPLPSVPTLAAPVGPGLGARSAPAAPAQASGIVRAHASAPALRFQTGPVAPMSAAPLASGELPRSRDGGSVAAASGVLAEEAPALAQAAPEVSGAKVSAQAASASRGRGERLDMVSRLSEFGKTLAEAGRSSGASLLAKAFDRASQGGDAAGGSARVEAQTMKRAGLAPSARGERQRSGDDAPMGNAPAGRG
ncbi:MAG: hypothetical protein AAB576_05785, partial [Elusimicrobiota bacterium]